MASTLRFLLVLATPLLVLAACGAEPDAGSPLETSIDVAGGVMADCPVGEISDLIGEIFPTEESIQHVATVDCGQIYRDLGKGKQTQAIKKAFQFLQKTLDQNDRDELLDPDPSVEDKIIELFAAIFTDLGFDFPDIDPDVLSSGEFAMGELRPNGPPLITHSKHAGIDDGGGLLGPVQAIIFQIKAADGGLEISSPSHPCPAGIEDDFDCYPLFFDYSVVPESNVNPAVGLQLGQCNVSPPDVEVLLLSPEGFLPEDDAPAGLDCTDVEPEVAMTGWRSYAWAVLEPIAPLFRVSKAFAGKSPIGGRISAFSPVAPVDPESGGESDLIPTQTDLSPESASLGFGGTQLFQAAVNEIEDGGVHGGTVRFTVTNSDNVDVVFDADLIEGTAEVDVQCEGEGVYGDIVVDADVYEVQAEFLGDNGTHEGSSDPVPSDLFCSLD